tara:strand:- start:932 stop:1324 length:393 start_codon:yes stop_codon:yes gene_type:complete
MKKKIKISLIAVAFDNKYDTFNKKRNNVLLHRDKLPYTFLMSEKTIEEALERLTQKYLNFHFKWLDVNLVGFRNIDEATCEAIYFTQFPYSSGFNRLGTPTNLFDSDLAEKLGDYYLDAISRHTTRKFVL